MLEKWMLKAKESLAKSPVRAGSDKPVSPQLDNFVKIQNQLDILLGNLEKKLAIVLMGEVKAGKSTIINALAGGQVSPTNTLECTSAILEISYSPEERAEIIFHDGRSVVDSVAKVFSTLEHHRGDEEFFRTCKVVKVGYPLPHLKRLRLVDTPGLATITERNEKTTREYIQSADVILWVLNANTPGDTEIALRLSEVAKAGKPIIIVVNRIDQIDSIPERVVDYVRGELGIYAREIFPLSAERAFNGVMKGDHDLMKSSGFTDLVNYLETKIDVRADAIKEESVRSSVEALLRYDLAMHDAYMKQLAFLEAQLSRHHEEVMRRSEKISFNLENWLLDRVNAPGGRALLEHEMRVILEKKAPTQKDIKNGFSLEAVRAWWTEVLQELGKEFATEWESSERLYAEDLETRIGSFDQSQPLIPEYSLDDQPSMLSRAISGIGEGIKIGGLAGAGMAAYAAWLGPYAASIAFLPAVTALMPPLLIFGGLGGLVAGLISRGRSREKLRAALESYVSQVRTDFIERFLKPQVFPAIREQSNTVAKELHHQLTVTLCNGWSERDIARLRDDLKGYIQSIELLLREAETPTWA